MTQRQLPKIVLAFSLLLLVAALSFLAFVLNSRSAEAPAVSLEVLGEAPAFSLTTSEGETFTEAALENKVSVAVFFFTSCAGPCPILSRQMAALQDAFQDYPELNLVSVTVDPETDSPGRLHAYGLEYGADFSRWHFLTGEIDAIKTLAVDGFKIGSIDDPTIHSNRMILMDRRGRIRGYYNGLAEEDVNMLHDAVRTLIAEDLS